MCIPIALQVFLCLVTETLRFQSKPFIPDKDIVKTVFMIVDKHKDGSKLCVILD